MLSILRHAKLEGTEPKSTLSFRHVKQALPVLALAAPESFSELIGTPLGLLGDRLIWSGLCDSPLGRESRGDGEGLTTSSSRSPSCSTAFRFEGTTIGEGTALRVEFVSRDIRITTERDRGLRCRRGEEIAHRPI
jgi:hypothetical protein